MVETAHDRLVVVGSSAGGIDALSELLSGIGEDFAAPIVVAQHLDPNRVSHLKEILARRTPLRVETVTSAEKLEAGVVYVVPADRDVTIIDGTVTVHDDSGKRPKPSVNRLFETAAQSYGESLVAVVLTGAGSDGADGARRVKLAGGTVVIQDPATARFPSMPLSLAPTTVDIVAKLDAMGPLLNDLVNGADGQAADSDDELFLARFLNLLREQTGIDFTHYKRPTIMRRLHRRMAAVRVPTLREYGRYATHNPAEYGRLATSFLIKVTEFFRDPDLFDLLRGDILPRLVTHAAERDQELRIWSAGCATGEEAYSLAILVAEALGDDFARRSVRIFATDLDAEAINFARKGLYSRSAIGSLPEDLVDRYFTRVGEEYEIRKHIRAITVFGQHDLAQRAPFPRIDLAVSRNVLIYFTNELQRRALQLFAFSLRDGGYLVLGKAETVSPLPEHFVVENPRLKVFKRQGDRILIPPARGLALSSDSALMLPPRAAARERPDLLALRGARDTRPTLVERAEQVLLRLPLGVVVLGQGYEIQFINSRARELLGIHGTALGQDFVHMTRDIPSEALRDAINGARGGPSTSISAELPFIAAGGAKRSLELSFLSQRSELSGGPHEGVVVVVNDVTGTADGKRDFDEKVRLMDEELVGVRRHVSVLEQTNRDLIAANQELTVANVELRSANEELLVGAEEVQAATEEVETLNEELQATNEELETLNEELQATVEELNTTNDDLEARTLELEELVKGETVPPSPEA